MVTVDRESSGYRRIRQFDAMSASGGKADTARAMRKCPDITSQRPVIYGARLYHCEFVYP